MTRSVRFDEPIRHLGDRRDRLEKGPLVAVGSAWVPVADELGPAAADSSFRRLKNGSHAGLPDLSVAKSWPHSCLEEKSCSHGENLSLDEDGYLFLLRLKGGLDEIQKWALRVQHLNG